jgi:nitrogen fixation protein FixH
MQDQSQTAGTPAWKSPWVIAWVAGVLIVLGANLFMVFLAVQTNPGLVAEDYYDRGQDYEKTLFSKRANAPDWHMRIGLPELLEAGDEIPVQFTILDRAGMPVQPDSVTFYAYRPSDASRDFSLPMRMESKGLYTTKAQFRLKGAWDILISVASGGEEYNLGQRIYLQAPY